MNKLTIAFVLASFMLGLSASAMDIAETDTALKITGNITGDTEARLNIQDQSGEIVWLDSVATDTDGNYSFDFVAPYTADTVSYTVTVNGSDKSTISIAGETDIVKSFSGVSKDNFEGYLFDYADRFGYDTDLLDGLSNMDTPYSIFKSCTIASRADVINAYYRACGIEAINEGDRGDALELLSSYSEYIAPTYTTDVKTFTKSQKEALAVALVKNDYSSYDAFQKGYANALKSAKASSSSSGSSGGGGGGGGSSSSTAGRGSYVSAPTTKTEDTATSIDELLNWLVSPFGANDSVIATIKAYVGVTK